MDLRSNSMKKQNRFSLKGNINNSDNTGNFSNSNVNSKEIIIK